MSSYFYRAPTESPLGPFTHHRWLRSPSPVPSESVLFGHGKWGDEAVSIPSKSDHWAVGPSRTPRSQPDASSDGSDAESEGPITPHAYSERKDGWGWQTSPFKDQRWKLELRDEGAEGEADGEGFDVLLAAGGGLAGKLRREAGGLGVELGNVRPEGGENTGQDQEERSADEWEDWRRGRGKRARRTPSVASASSSDEADPREGGLDGLRRVLWPARPRVPPQTKSIRSGFPNARPELVARHPPPVDPVDEEDRFWFDPRYHQHVERAATPEPVQVRNDHSNLPPPALSLPIRRSPSPSPGREPLPGPTLHLGTHLASRLGHLRLLDAAERLVQEDGMSGLSMFLYCPKKHVREIWSEEKIWAVRQGLDRLDWLSPGFSERIFVHAHETINLACPAPIIGSSSTTMPSSSSAIFHLTIEGLSIEMATLEQLGLKYLVVHPGSSIRCGGKGNDRATLKIIAGNIDTLLERHPGITIVLESMTCCNGRLAGTTLRSLARIRHYSSFPARIKFCLDLCHVHSISHDLSSSVGRQTLFDDVDTWLGAENVVCAHVSECAVPHGSKRDLHADFGAGYIGDEGFRTVIRHPPFEHITWIIETPRYLPRSVTSHAIEALEVDRQALDIEHLRILANTPAGEWADEVKRVKRKKRRRKAIKDLRRKMWAAVPGYKVQERREGEERRKRERKRRGRLGKAKARAVERVGEG